MPRVLHILLTDYKVDSRVRNITESLISSGVAVDIFCLQSPETQKVEWRNGVQIRRYGIPSGKIATVLTAYVQFVLHAMKGDYRLVHAHDFTALPVGLLIAKMKRIPLVYDSHELWSESEHGNYPGWVFKIAYRIEKMCARRADVIITVSDSIRDYLKNYFGKAAVETVRNIPSYAHRTAAASPDTPSGLRTHVPTFIFAGSIDKKRGLYTILEALRLIGDMEYRFIFLVDAHVVGELAAVVEQYGLGLRVSIAPSVPQDELIHYLSTADIGVHAIENTCLNHEYCLPNKIFEYIHAGIAVLCTDVKEMSRLVHEHAIGLTFRSGDAGDLAEKMKILVNEAGAVNAFKVNARKLRTSLSWRGEFEKLQKIYGGLIQQ